MQRVGARTSVSGLSRVCEDDTEDLGFVICFRKFRDVGREFQILINTVSFHALASFFLSPHAFINILQMPITIRPVFDRLLSQAIMLPQTCGWIVRILAHAEIRLAQGTAQCFSDSERWFLSRSTTKT